MTAGRLRDLIAGDELHFAPGAWDALSAILVEEAGFPLLDASGFAISASLGLPDAGLYTMSENLESVRRITGAVSLPVIADIDAGYGNAINVFRTVREFARAGVAAVHLEDQVTPKRCPLYGDDPVPVLDVREAAGKVRAAVDARGDSDMLIVARSDAPASETLDRLARYAEAGADMVMPVSRSYSSLEELRAFRDAAGVPLMISVPGGSWLEGVPPTDLAAAGVRVATVPLQALFGAVAALRRQLAAFAETGDLSSFAGSGIGHDEFSRLVGFDRILDQQRTYVDS